jgi:hypothetical protein
MVALSHFDISKNSLKAEGGRLLAEALKGNQVITKLNIASNTLGYDSDGRANMSGVTALADAMPDMGALLSLNLSKNALLTKEAGKVLGDLLKGNSILKELDVSSNYVIDASARDGPGFAQELSDGIKDNVALITLDISSNVIGAEQEGELQRICVASGIELAK